MNFKRLLLVSLIVFVGVVVNSCNKHAFDFSRMDSVDAEGSWGIPLVNAQLSIEDILNMAEDLTFIQTGQDGTLELTYQMEIDSVIKSDRLLGAFKDRVIETSKTHIINGNVFPNLPQMQFDLLHDTVTLDLPNDEVELEYGKVKSGELTMTLTHDIPIDFVVELYSSQLLDQTGQAFHDTFNIPAYQTNTIHLDLGGMAIVPKAENDMDVYVRLHAISSGQPVSESPTIQYTIRLEDIVIEELRGRFFSFDVDVNEGLDFDLGFLAERLGGSITLFNPQVDCQILNDFPIGANLVINEAALTGPGMMHSPLLTNTPVTVQIPAHTTDFVPVNIPIAQSLYLNTRMNRIQLAGKAILNPDGMNTPVLDIREGQFISIKFSVSLPLKVRMDDITFKDTLDFGGAEIPNLDGISNILIRAHFENQLPLNMSMQAYFYDSRTRLVRDSLFTSPLELIGCYNENMPSVSDTYVAKDDIAQIRRMLNCDKIILKAKIDTDDQQVAIRSDQKLKVRLGIKFDVDLGTLANQIND